MAHDMLSELQQKKPFAHPEEELFLSLTRTVDVLGRSLYGLLKDNGLSQAQYNVLRILRGAGPGGMPCGEIGQRMVTRDPDVTRLLDRLARSGWVERGRGMGDRRVVSAKILPPGLKLLEDLEGPLLHLHKSQLGFLSEEDSGALLKLLERMREHLEQLGAGEGAAR